MFRPEVKVVVKDGAICTVDAPYDVNYATLKHSGDGALTVARQHSGWNVSYDADVKTLTIRCDDKIPPVQLAAVLLDVVFIGRGKANVECTIGWSHARLVTTDDIRTKAHRCTLPKHVNHVTSVSPCARTGLFYVMYEEPHRPWSWVFRIDNDDVMMTHEFTSSFARGMTGVNERVVLPVDGAASEHRACSGGKNVLEIYEENMKCRTIKAEGATWSKPVYVKSVRSWFSTGGRHIVKYTENDDEAIVFTNVLDEDNSFFNDSILIVNESGDFLVSTKRGHVRGNIHDNPIMALIEENDDAIDAMITAMVPQFDVDEEDVLQLVQAPSQGDGAYCAIVDNGFTATGGSSSTSFTLEAYDTPPLRVDETYKIPGETTSVSYFAPLLIVTIAVLYALY